MILAGDIGGTKTLLAFFSPASGPGEPIDLRSFRTQAARPPADVIAEYLQGKTVEAAVLGVAGAVLDGEATGSNLPWTVRTADLEPAAGAPTRLVNDLHAMARWVPELAPGDVRTLQEGRREPTGAIGVVAPGTGLGEAMLCHDGRGYRPMPSEAGHIDFAPANELQASWWAHLHAIHGHVSLERACSGSSLPALVDFLAAVRERPLQEAVARETAAADDATPVLLAAGLEGRCAICREAVEVFADMLAAAAGNLALQIVATGGIYLGGGLSPRLLPLLDTERWRTRFCEKGRFHELMERIPVHVMVDDRAGLFGAASLAFDAADDGGV